MISFSPINAYAFTPVYSEVEPKGELARIFSSRGEVLATVECANCRNVTRMIVDALNNHDEILKELMRFKNQPPAK